MTPKIAAARIARQLKAAEQQADRALLECSKLMAEIVEARQATGVEPSTGQDALIRLARAQTSIVESGNDLLRVHDSMYRVGREMGILEEKAIGPSVTHEAGLQIAA